jgi:DNA repair exonuclease SbcCD ATPase subunit
MRLARVEIKNWRCFRGEHAIDLDAGAHAIVARHERDAERSNWLGKSSFLWALRFALTGALPKDCRTQDDWTTRGGREGAVAVELSDGTRAERSRVRGGPTVLVVQADGKQWKGAEAQAEIDRRLGLTPDDAGVWFLAQKSFDRFVRMRPSERAAEVAEWLKLEPLRRAEASVRAELSGLLDEETKLAARERADRDALAALLLRHEILPETPTTVVLEQLASAERSAKERVVDATQALAALEEERRVEQEARADERRRREREELAREAKRATEEAERAEEEARAAEAEVPPRVRLIRLRSRAEQAQAEAERARRELRERQSLARGEFDGACPVGGIVCPAKDLLNARHRENAAAAREAASNASAAREAAETARTAQDTAEGRQRAAERARARATAAREKADALRARLDRTAPVAAPSLRPREGLDREIAEVRARRDEANDDARAALMSRREAERLGRSIAETVSSLAENRSKARTRREAVEILGRRGAQRRIAEEALREVEDGANTLLARSGVALTVRFRWERETGGLASACDACGAPFPASVRVKECGRCGGARGPKIDERLDVELSDRSGAAEDLAGLAISLAASLRLRRERGSDWGLICLDEPFGALDRAHRRALSRGLVQMLAGRWEQALVIAHDDGVLDALPGRIVVTAGDGGSRVERA